MKPDGSVCQAGGHRLDDQGSIPNTTSRLPWAPRTLSIGKALEPWSRLSMYLTSNAETYNECTPYALTAQCLGTGKIENSESYLLSKGNQELLRQWQNQPSCACMSQGRDVMLSKGINWARSSGNNQWPTFLSPYIEYLIRHGPHKKHHVEVILLPRV
jgi:hypothetical protein